MHILVICVQNFTPLADEQVRKVGPHTSRFLILNGGELLLVDFSIGYKSLMIS